MHEHGTHSDTYISFRRLGVKESCREKTVSTGAAVGGLPPPFLPRVATPERVALYLTRNWIFIFELEIGATQHQNLKAVHIAKPEGTLRLQNYKERPLLCRAVLGRLKTKNLNDTLLSHALMHLPKWDTPLFLCSTYTSGQDVAISKQVAVTPNTSKTFFFSISRQ